jgi:hypothetical protein
MVLKYGCSYTFFLIFPLSRTMNNTGEIAPKDGFNMPHNTARVFGCRTDHQRIAHQIDQKCRNVAPQAYKNNEYNCKIS